MNGDFPKRLAAAFDNQTMAQIARRVGVPHATVRNYFQGRLPSPEVLIKIAQATQVSLNWLLMGTGEMFTEAGARRDIGRLIEDRIEEIVEQKLADRRAGTVQELGTVDAAPPSTSRIRWPAWATRTRSWASGSGTRNVSIQRTLGSIFSEVGRPSPIRKGSTQFATPRRF